VRLGLGDDVAAIDPPRGAAPLLLTTDAFSEGYHFLPTSPPRAIGRAIVGVNASDLAATGGVPLFFLLDLGLPPGTPESWAKAVVQGARAELRRLGAELVGGDTKPAARRMVVGTFLGRASSPRLAPRSGARPGDAVVLTGTVGGPGWVAEHRRGGTAGARALDELLEVRPRLEEGRELVRVAHAMLDTSDGFADSARILAEASRCRIVLDPGALPLDRRLLSSPLDERERLEVAAYGGEYELMAAVPARAFASLARRFQKRRLAPLHRVGRVERGSGAWFHSTGDPRPLPLGRWRPWG
jgi:thiamine-monophosphate kinase